MMIDTAPAPSLAGAQDHAVRLAFDTLAVGAAVAATVDAALPHLVQLCAGALVMIRLWETDTVQGWASHWRARSAARPETLSEGDEI